MAKQSVDKASGAAAEMDERLERILEDVVEEHVRTGRPVGSRRLTRAGSYEMSPATVRNLMSDLEEAGYLSQPHTSAGRTPTDKGYRFYVNRLLARGEPSRDSGENPLRVEAPEGVFPQASRLLALATHHVGVVLAPSAADSHLKHIEFISVASDKVLAVLVTAAGLVHHRIIPVSDSAYGADELRRIGALLREEFGGRTLREIRERLVALMAEDRARYDTLLQRAAELAGQCFGESADAAGDLYVEGTPHILESPSFNVGEMRALFEAVEEKHRIVRLLNECIENREELVVCIGSENPDARLQPFALVAAGYAAPRGERGTLGILGPTRMDYGSALRAVGGVARMLSEAISERES